MTILHERDGFSVQAGPRLMVGWPGIGTLELHPVLINGIANQWYRAVKDGADWRVFDLRHLVWMFVMYPTLPSPVATCSLITMHLPSPGALLRAVRLAEQTHWMPRRGAVA
jgi:hypothetical protein